MIDLENLAGHVGLVSSNHDVKVTGGAYLGKFKGGPNSKLHVELLI